MPDIPTPTDPVEIDLGDGKLRHLRYSLGSMKRLKKKFGTTMISATALSDLDEDKLSDLIYEGLVEKDGLTLDDMADLIDTRNLKAVIDAFSQAFSGAKPEKNGASPSAQIQ